LSDDGNSITLFAQWKPIVYTVTFDTNGGNVIEPQTIGYNFEQKRFNYATIPEEPVKEGYTFAGWYSNKKLTTKYNFNKPVKKDITLYTKWK
jgi:uncharacterized repeat protein (TIGR02543 family)